MENKKDALQKILEQYEKNSKPKETSSKTFDLKNYFSTYLPDGVTSGKKKIRILPARVEGETPFSELFIHAKEIDGKSRKFACLKEMYGKDCPFCEAREALYASGEDTDKELAKKYYPRRTYICRVIDRDHEDEGVKFWRFNHDFRNQGTFDKIMAIISEKGNVTLNETGRDLVVHLGRDQNNNSIIKSITDSDPSPISSDPEKVKEWVEDEKDWSDVYSVKPYEYLEIIVKGGIPVWDKKTESFVDKATLVDEESETTDSSEELENQLKNDSSELDVDNYHTSDEEDDLPF